MESDRFVLRSVTDEIMYALMEISGQEYVDNVRDTRQGDQGRAHSRLGLTNYPS